MSNRRAMMFGLKNNNFIDSGFVYYLDFGNSACYTGSGLSASDLVTSDSFTILPIPFYSSANGGVFDSNDAEAIGTSAGIPSSILGNVDFSVAGWFKLRANFVNGSAWGFGKASTANNFNAFSPNTNEIAISLNEVNVFGTGQAFSTSQWKYIVWTKKSGVFSRANCEIYINNVKYTGSGLTDIYGGETTTPNILNDNKIVLGNTSTLLTQKSRLIFGEFKIYNKVLTADEVNGNYLNGLARYT